MDGINKLRILSARINRIDPKVNSGGCCIVAAVVAKQLCRFIPVKIRVINHAGRGNKSIIKARYKVGYNEVSEWNENGIYFGHVLLEFKVNGVTHYWDTETFAPAIHSKYTRWKLHPGALTVKEAWELGNDTDGWNDSFNRDNIQTIRNAVYHFFKYSINMPYEKLAMNELTIQHKLDTNHVNTNIRNNWLC